MFSGEQLNKFLLSKTEELGIISREHPLDDKLTCSHYLKHNNILESQGEFTCKSPLRARLKIRKVRKHVNWTNPFLSIMSSLQHRHLISTSQCYYSQSFIQLAMFGLELEWTVGGGVGGGGKARRRLPEETVEKQNTP